MLGNVFKNHNKKHNNCLSDFTLDSFTFTSSVHDHLTVTALVTVWQSQSHTLPSAVSQSQWVTDTDWQSHSIHYHTRNMHYSSSKTCMFSFWGHDHTRFAAIFPRLPRDSHDSAFNFKFQQFCGRHVVGMLDLKLPIHRVIATFSQSTQAFNKHTTSYR